MLPFFRLGATWSVLLCLAACGGASPEGRAAQEDAGPTSQDAGPGGDGSTPPSDQDDGPLWDGTAPAPKVLARGALGFAPTTDGKLVYSDEAGTWLVDTASAARTSLSSDVYRNDLSLSVSLGRWYGSGKSALYLSSTRRVGWSAVAGFRPLSGLPADIIGGYTSFDLYPSADGATTLLVLFDKNPQTSADYWRMYEIDSATLAAREVAIPAGDVNRSYCDAWQAGFACVFANTNTKTSRLVLIDGAGAAQTRADLGFTSGFELVGKTLVAQDGPRLNAVRLDDTSAPLSLATNVARHAALSSGWVAYETTDHEVDVVRLDGTAKRVVASSSTLQVDDGAPGRWFGYDKLEAGRRGYDTTLVDPDAAKTVPLGKPTLFQGATASSTYAVIFDKWTESSGPIGDGRGDAVVVDLRDGTRRVLALTGAGFPVYAQKMKKSRLLLRALSHGTVFRIGFFDAHSSPSARVYEHALFSEVTFRQIHSEGSRILLGQPTTRDDVPIDLYDFAP
jgi:hypothetical protein